MTYFSDLVHEDLLKQADQIVSKMKQIWRSDGSIVPYAFAWPEGPIRTDGGDPLENMVMMRVLEDKEGSSLRRFATRTKACGLLLIKEEESSLIGIFETKYGARSWKIPIERRGDYWALGAPLVEDNHRSMGILWSPPKGTS